jgi:hypothetical protein
MNTSYSIDNHFEIAVMKKTCSAEAVGRCLLGD